MSQKKRLFERVRAVFRPTLTPPPPPTITIPNIKVERKTAPIVPSAVNSIALREAMLNHLSLDDVQSLCTQLNIDYTQLSGGKGRKIMNLITECERRQTMPRLLSLCQLHNADVEWQQSWD